MFTSSQFIKKREKPVLTKEDIPYKAGLIFNAGVAKFNGKYVMIFRNDVPDVWGERVFSPGSTNLGFATSDDGINWTSAKAPSLTLDDYRDKFGINDRVTKFYDPRLTVIDGIVYMCFAIDTAHGVCGGVATTEDFEHFDIKYVSVPENRNMVIFPGKIGGNFVRLERPMPVYSRGRDRFDTWMSFSPDLKYWGNTKFVFGVEDVPFANDKVGPGAPPILTEKGWLTTFHAVWRDETRGKHGWEPKWTKIYTAGIMLLDKDEPWKILGMSKEPLIAPELPYEKDEGFRTDVIFPGGMLLDGDEVKIYYGAADTVEAVCTADVNDLISLCI